MKTFTDKIEMLYISDDEDSANLHIKSISYVSDDEHMSEQTTNLQSQCSFLLTSSFIQVKSYQKTTDCSADAVQNTDEALYCSTDQIVSERNNELKNTDYYSFHNKTDYIFMLWLHCTQATKKSVNMFFKDLQLNSMQSLLSFKNADE